LEAQPTNTLSSGEYTNKYIVQNDIPDLIWAANGPHKNYVNVTAKSENVNINSFSVNVSFLSQEEPSAIHTSMPTENYIRRCKL